MNVIACHAQAFHYAFSDSTEATLKVSIRGRETMIFLLNYYNVFLYLQSS